MYIGDYHDKISIVNVEIVNITKLWMKDESNMIPVLETIAKNLEKDIFDYLGIFMPTILSLVAIIISLWTGVWCFRKKRIEAYMVWDDLHRSFFIIIKNSGKRTLIIKEVSLIAYSKFKKYELGKRDNVWATKQDKSFINENEAIVIKPIYYSLYDIFAYRGHYFGVNKDNEKLKVYIIIKDIDNRKWKIKTSFSLKEVDEKLNYAVTIE